MNKTEMNKTEMNKTEMNKTEVALKTKPDFKFKSLAPFDQ